MYVYNNPTKIISKQRISHVCKHVLFVMLTVMIKIMFPMIDQSSLTGRRDQSSGNLSMCSQYLHFLHPSLEITCLHLATWDGLMISPANVHVGAKVNITCEENYVFGENSSTSLSCLENGTWYPDYPHCKCELSWLKTVKKWHILMKTTRLIGFYFSDKYSCFC